MADSRGDLITKIEAQRETIREHIDKYNRFKRNGNPTSTAVTTIENSQALIRQYRSKDRSIGPNDVDSWEPDNDDHDEKW